MLEMIIKYLSILQAWKLTLSYFFELS